MGRDICDTRTTPSEMYPHPQSCHTHHAAAGRPAAATVQICGQPYTVFQKNRTPKTDLHTSSKYARYEGFFTECIDI